MKLYARLHGILEALLGCLIYRLKRFWVDVVRRRRRIFLTLGESGETSLPSSPYECLHVRVTVLTSTNMYEYEYLPVPTSAYLQVPTSKGTEETVLSHARHFAIWTNSPQVMLW